MNSIQLLPIVYFAIVSLSAGAAVQEKGEQLPANKLATAIHVDCGMFTLVELLDLISHQSRLRITCSSFIRDRQVFASFPRVSAIKALNSVCELNGWEIKERVTDNYIVSPIAPKPPKDTQGIPTFIRNSLPRDLQKFCHFDKLAGTSISDRADAANAGFTMLNRFGRARGRLADYIIDKFDLDKSMQMPDLNADLRRTLLASHFFRYFTQTRDVVYDLFGPHKLISGTLTLSSMGGLLLVNSVFQEVADDPKKLLNTTSFSVGSLPVR